MNNYLNKLSCWCINYNRTKKILVGYTFVGSDISYLHEQTRVDPVQKELPDMGLLCLQKR